MYRSITNGAFRCYVHVPRDAVIMVPRKHAMTSGVSQFNPYKFKHSDRYAEERSDAEAWALLESGSSGATFVDDGDIEDLEEDAGSDWGSYNDFGDE